MTKSAAGVKDIVQICAQGNGGALGRQDLIDKEKENDETEKTDFVRAYISRSSLLGNRYAMQQIAGGFGHTFALKDSGTVRAKGIINNENQLDEGGYL